MTNSKIHNAPGKVMKKNLLDMTWKKLGVIINYFRPLSCLSPTWKPFLSLCL